MDDGFLIFVIGFLRALELGGVSDQSRRRFLEPPR